MKLEDVLKLNLKEGDRIERVYVYSRGEFKRTTLSYKQAYFLSLHLNEPGQERIEVTDDMIEEEGKKDNHHWIYWPLEEIDELYKLKRESKIMIAIKNYGHKLKNIIKSKSLSSFMATKM